VAADKSVAPDRYAGGDVGFVPLNALPTAVAETVKTLPEGVISPVIETEYGYFLVQVEGKKEGGAIPLEEVSDEIYGKIRDDKEGKAYAKWLEELRAAAKIKVEENILEKI
jgi:parvulin-like peptidyl-prolyl isomerase